MTIAQFQAFTSFDPAGGPLAGAARGMELAALYDVLLRLNLETGEYEPGTAESMEPNEDFTEWTLTLKSGIRFTDGTAYDAEAVKFNIEHQMAPESRSSARAALVSFIDDMTVVDDVTLRFTLTEPWSGFRILFAWAAGLVASPTAIEAAGDDFGTAPGDAGAGPFKVASFTPGEELVLVRNDDYHGDPAPLDELRFVHLPGGADQAYLFLEDGSVDGIFIRDPVVLANAVDDGFRYLNHPQPSGELAMLNAGIVVTCSDGEPAAHCAGRDDGEAVSTNPPTEDPRVRLAIAYALDRDVINERVWDGTAETSASVYPPSFPEYTPAVTFPDHDPDRAAELVEAAKADGWDGRIRVMAASDPRASAWGETVSALLRTVGMDVDLDISRDQSGVVQQALVQRDFDVIWWSSGLYGGDADFFQFFSFWGSETGRWGYRSEAFDTALDTLRVAATTEERATALEGLLEVWAEEMPAAPIATATNALVMADHLHGVTQTAYAMMLLHDAWVER